jgi:hypothetical protein
MAGKKGLKTLTSLVEQYRDDFALPETEAELLVSSAEHIATLRGTEQRQYAQKCADYYRQQRPSDFFIRPEGRQIFDKIADAYTQISQETRES